MQRCPSLQKVDKKYDDNNLAESFILHSLFKLLFNNNKIKKNNILIELSDY